MSDQDEPPIERQKQLEFTPEHLTNLKTIEDRRLELYKKLPCVLFIGPSCFNNGSTYYEEVYFPTRELALQTVKKIHGFVNTPPYPSDTTEVFSNDIVTDDRIERSCCVSTKHIPEKTWGYDDVSVFEEKGELCIRHTAYGESAKELLFLEKYTPPYSYPVKLGICQDETIHKHVPFPKTIAEFDRCFILGQYRLEGHSTGEMPIYFLKHPINSVLWDSIEAAYTGEYWNEYIPGRGNLDELVSAMQKFLEAEKNLSNLAIQMKTEHLSV